MLIDLGQGRTRLGGSALAQVYNQIGNEAPDVDTTTLKRFFTELTKLKQAGKILAYHDRSDGGLLTTVLEMAFASRCGLELDLTGLPGTTLEKFFNEELGAVIQVKKSDVATVLKTFGKAAAVIGQATKVQEIHVTDGSKIYRNSRAQLETWWSETSYQLQKLRDNPVVAEQELAAIQDNKNPGLSPQAVVGCTPRAHTQGGVHP
jgi:phosphoribosylformylglycinamidine synthase